jgi:CHAT domain-containing protein
MSDKLSFLMKIHQLQVAASPLLVESERAKSSGDWKKAHAAYQNYIETLENLLDTEWAHNEQFPESPFDLHPTANILVNALLVSADISTALGNREEAESRRQTALAVSREHLGRVGEAEVERSRAASLTLEGRFNEAIIALMSARDTIIEKGDLLELTRITIDLADVFQWLGDFKRAREEIVHAEELIRPLLQAEKPSKEGVLRNLLEDFASIMSSKGDPGSALRMMQLYRASVEVTYYRGLIARALEDWEEAARCMEAVLPEYRKLGSGEAIEYQLAMINTGRGRHREALQQIHKIAPVFETGAYRPKRGVLQRAQAECLHALGESDMALQLLDQSIADLAQDHFDPDALWRVQWLKAKVCSGEGRENEGLEALRGSLETINSLRRAPLGYRLDSTFLVDKLEVFSSAVARTLKAGDLRSCCAYMDSVKSRTLAAVLSVSESSKDAATDVDRDFEEITRQLDALDYQTFREGPSRERTQARKQLLQKRADLIELIRISEPRWRTLREPYELDFDQLLASLAERGQAAMSLFLDGRKVYAVLLCDGELISDSLEFSDDTIVGLQGYAKNLQKEKPNPFEHDLSSEYSITADQLIPPTLLERAIACDSMVVIPHGILHLVPWSGLIYKGSRLFQSLPVGVLPNLASLLLREAVPEPSNVAVVGVSHYGGAEMLCDLPSAKEEVDAVERVYGKRRLAARLLDEDATEEAFWDRLTRFKGVGNVLHMSCHGVIVPNEPMNSGLLLYDSKVDAAEVARANLHFGEVVLSACWTGWRPLDVLDVVLASDEIISIPGGFLESKAHSVLVSIPVGEGKSARDLTTKYHERRAAGETPLFAYRTAQLHMLEQDEVKPALWIGFTLYGCQ